MKTGIELISQERQEQIEKHGFTLDNDLRYEVEELRYAALYCLSSDIKYWPSGWSHGLRKRLDEKPIIERIAIAGAFSAAEIDRLQAAAQQEGGSK